MTGYLTNVAIPDLLANAIVVSKGLFVRCIGLISMLIVL